MLPVEERNRKLENDPNWSTILLPVDQREDRHEEVLVESLGGGRRRVAATPGMVLNLACDDVIEIAPDSPDGYRLVSRGGNIGVHLFCAEDRFSDLRVRLPAHVESIGGWLDGTMARSGLCFTFPLAVGFPKIEAFFDAVVQSTPQSEWFYSNVYDPSDGVTPLDWWLDIEESQR